MELSNKKSEEKAFNTKPYVEEQMLIVMDTSIHEEQTCQPLQTIIKQIKKKLLFSWLVIQE